MLHREQVAVLGSYRTDDLHRRHPLRPVIAELLRLPHVTPVDLGPLDPASLAAHIAALAESAGRRRVLDAPELITIVDRAEGNAYYAEELLAASGGDEELPAGLAALLMTRVEQLSVTAQQALRAAAVGGRRVDDELVMEASGLSAPEYEAAIREAVAHQLLAADGQEGYAFRHALLREAIYADLLPGERTRLHATLAGLLADEKRLDTVPGSSAELAHHCLASHDIAGAFAASVRAGKEAEHLAAPAEAHRHYDQALALWDRVDEPQKLGGMDRVRLALKSATNAAESGDIPRAVHQLRRVSSVLPTIPVDPDLVSRINERLAFYLLQLELEGEAADAARTAIDALPPEPPTWERARSMATYANVLLLTDDELAREQAECARQAAKAADAPWVEADALVTLGQVSERSGHIEEMFEQFAAAHRQAGQERVLGVELRAAFHLARARLERGDLTEAAMIAHQGFSRAEKAGLARAPYGTDLQYLHYLAHYGDGDWDHAQELADGFSIRVTTNPEAELSAMALFIDVARGHDEVIAERHRWLEPFWPDAEFAEYTARGLLAEHALWHGDAETALAEIDAALKAEADEAEDYGPPVIRLAAIGLSARADRACRARGTGDEATARAEVEAARELIEAARVGAEHRRRPKAVLGLEGRAWLARAEAEWRRATGDNSAEAWQSVLEAFDPDFVYEAARARWRLAEALAEAGRRDEAQREWDKATGVAAQLGAVPLRSGARRPGTPGQARPRSRAGVGRRQAGQAGRPDQPGAGSAAADRGRPQQPGDRRHAVHRAEDGQRARVEHPGQAGCREPYRGGGHRARRGPDRDRQHGKQLRLAAQRPDLKLTGRGRGRRGFPRALHRRCRVGIRGADLRIPVEIVEDLGDAAAGEPGRIGADLVI